MVQRTDAFESELDGLPLADQGHTLNPSFAQGARLRHEIYIDTGDKARNEALFEHLSGQRERFESEYGRALQWEALPNAWACRIADYGDDADVTYEDRHDEFIDWFFDAGVRLRRALAAVAAPSA